ncbi:mesothelin-like protein [Callorhinchus milii]|uniref:mesothelin-like protein n=1 Tax=Callorhinchus milii TaxID=7868 RepID=UPI001C3F8C31|nr:mesothelin-like protein [Callorhinchus milii]
MNKAVSPDCSLWVKLMTVTVTIGFFLVSTCSAQRALFRTESQSPLEMLVKERVKRAVCPQGIITPQMTTQLLLPIRYPAADLDPCLSDEVLANNLTQLGNLAFNVDQLLVLKSRLTQLYPSGLPQEQLKQLGYIITVYGPGDVSRWNITDPDILASVLQNSPTPNLTNIIVSNYLREPGVLNTAALNAIGGKLLCTASEEKLRTILPTDLKNTNPLNISTCTQLKKDILYGIAKDAFEDRSGNLSANYRQINSYLGGAPAIDLQRLAAANVNMDIETFLNLNPVEVVKLSAQEVRDLLGVNLPKLKENESDPLVQAWIRTHSQADVRSLGVGLSGGRPSEQEFELGHFDFAEGHNSASSNHLGLQCSFLVGVIIIAIQRVL